MCSNDLEAYELLSPNHKKHPRNIDVRLINKYSQYKLEVDG